jgi:hypothetical protein
MVSLAREDAGTSCDRPLKLSLTQTADRQAVQALFDKD